MAESDNQPQGEPEDSRKFAIQKIYVKDVSFESPQAPRVFTEKWNPKISLELHTDGSGLEGSLYEVVLSLTVTAKNGEQTAFLVEVQQSGIFQLEGFNQRELSAMLGSYCPNVLFPYAREAVSDLVTRGGFPQLLLSPVNFDALYAQHLEEQRRQQAAPPAPEQEAQGGPPVH